VQRLLLLLVAVAVVRLLVAVAVAVVRLVFVLAVGNVGLSVGLSIGIHGSRIRRVAVEVVAAQLRGHYMAQIIQCRS